jgi:hypothetical protein
VFVLALAWFARLVSGMLNASSKEVVMASLDEAERRLRAACADKDFSFSVSFSEAEQTYYASADGQGVGEFVEVKRLSSMAEAMDQLADRVTEWRAFERQ